MPSGGDMIQISWNDPNLGSGTFYGKSGEDTTVNTGGAMTDDSDTNIDTAGNFINTMRLIPWKISSTISWDMINPQRREIEMLKKLTGTVNSQDFVFTNINGVNYTGNGKVVGAVEGSAKDCTMTITFMGGGTLAQI